MIYIFSEVYTFENIPSENNSIRLTRIMNEISQDVPSEAFTQTYDPETKVLTINYTGDGIYPGSQAETKVSVTTETGVTLETGQLLCGTALESVTLTVSQTDEGSIQYTVSGQYIQPSFGSVTVYINLYPDHEGFILDDVAEAALSPQSITLNDPGPDFSHTFTVSGITVSYDKLTACADVSLSWDGDSKGYVFRDSSTSEYSYSTIRSISDISDTTDIGGIPDTSDMSGTPAPSGTPDVSGTPDTSGTTDMSSTPDTSDISEPTT